MSSEAAAEEMCCANCGISAIDDVKLKDCDGGCDLVKYCSDDCQDNHREQHDEECRKRLVEIRDRDLFTMPEGSHWGECPICCLPLPIDPSKSTFMGCCSKTICNGCHYANVKREDEAGLENRCAFCREPMARSEEEADKRVMKRVKKNCPVALRYMGNKRYQEGDYKSAFEYWTKAAELGYASAHYNLSVIYGDGEGVEKDTEKEVYHLEEAAIGGHPMARHYLGSLEAKNRRYDRAVKHLIIAANLGHEGSVKGLKRLYADGHASKEDYADALRAYQAAMDETKSSERERAEEAKKNGEIK
jgi:tetratricopeptide (TPR) repeat protein